MQTAKSKCQGGGNWFIVSVGEAVAKRARCHCCGRVIGIRMVSKSKSNLAFIQPHNKLAGATV